MALNVDKNRQLNGTQPQPAASQPAAKPVTTSNQPIDMTSGAKEEKEVYQVQKGDSLWSVAKQKLIDAGNPKPSDTEVWNAMVDIAKANGCKDVEECRQKFFNDIGSELNVTGLFVEHNNEDDISAPESEEAEAEMTPVAEEKSKLAEEEQKLSTALKSRYPDLDIDKMSDTEMKKMLDNIKENQPELLSALKDDAEQSHPVADESIQNDNNKEIIQKLFDKNNITAETIQSDDFKAKFEELVKNASIEEMISLTNRISELGLSKEEISKLFEQLKPAKDNLKTVIEDYLKENPEALKPPKSGGSVAKSELEIVAEQVKDKFKIEGDIDEVLRIVKMKSKGSEDLTDIEKKFLNLLDNQQEKPQDLSRKNYNVLSVVKNLGKSDILKLPLNQQLETLTSQYLSKDEKYNSLSGKEKEAYFKKTLDTLANMASSGNADWKYAKGAEKQKIFKRAMAILSIAEDKNLSLEQLQATSPKEKEALINEYKNKIIDTTISDIIKEINTEVYSQLSIKDKVDYIAEIMLTMEDDEFNSKSPEEKAKLKRKLMDTLIEKFGINTDGSEEQYDRACVRLICSLEAINTLAEKNGTNISHEINNFKNSSMYLQNKILIDTLETLEQKGTISDEQKNILEMLRNRRLILEHFPEKDPDTKQTLARIEELLANKDAYDLNDKQIEFLKNELRVVQKAYSMNQKGKYAPSLTNKESCIVDGMKKSFQECLKKSKKLNKLENEPSLEGKLALLNNSEYIQYFKDYMEKADIKESNLMIDRLRQMGLSDKVIEKYFQENNIMSDDAIAYRFARANKDELATYAATMVAIGGGSIVKKFLENVPSEAWNDVNDNATISKIGVAIAEDESLTDSLYIGLQQNRSHSDIVEITTDIGKSENISNAGIANIYRSAVSTAPDDASKLYYGQELSKRTSNAAALEGLASASNSIQDNNIRSQYNSAVNYAASNCSAEEKAAISKAMETGKISEQTQSQTKASSDNSTQSKSSSDKTTSDNTTSNKDSKESTVATTSSNSSAAASTSTASGSGSTTNPIKSGGTTAPVSSSSSTVSSSSSSTISNDVSSSRATNSTYTTSTSSSSSHMSASDVEKVAASNETMRQEAMDKAKETADAIKTSIKEWEDKHRKLSADEVDVVMAAASVEAAKDILESSSISETRKEEIYAKIANATSVDEIHTILVNNNLVTVAQVKEKVGELLQASGSSTSVRAFIKDLLNDDSFVKKLYVRCSSSSVKKELLNLMSTDTISALLQNGSIHDLSVVNPRILRSFIERNIYSMSNTQFNEYLKHLSLEDRQALVALRQEARGQAQPIQAPPTEDHSADMASASQTAQKATGDMIRTRADGLVETRQGTGFAGISDNESDEMYRVVAQNEQDGSPIGMNDDVLTVGSAEWNQKYNRGNVQSTAFTMAAMDEEDEDYQISGGYPPQKIPPWKYKGKLNFKG